MQSVEITGVRERRIRIVLTTPTRPSLVTVASSRVPGARRWRVNAGSPTRPLAPRIVCRARGQVAPRQRSFTVLSRGTPLSASVRKYEPRRPFVPS